MRARRRLMTVAVGQRMSVQRQDVRDPVPARISGAGYHRGDYKVSTEGEKRTLQVWEGERAPRGQGYESAKRKA
jgi:hypothetical protein